jgi:hypothetical protein
MDNSVQSALPSITLQRVLLICGIIAVPLYAATDMIAGTLYHGYSFADQAVSELFAIGAPTSGLVVPLFTLYSLLVLAFAFGVWMAAGRKHRLRAVALLLIANALNGLVLWNFFPMHMRGDETSFTDTVHVILAAAGGIIGVIAVGFGAASFGRRFLFYSIGTIVMMFFPTTLTFMLAPQVAANESSPWIGLLERTAFAVFWQWQIVLAIILLRKERVRVTSHGLKGNGDTGSS